MASTSASWPLLLTDGSCFLSASVCELVAAREFASSQSSHKLAPSSLLCILQYEIEQYAHLVFAFYLYVPVYDTVGSSRDSIVKYTAHCVRMVQKEQQHMVYIIHVAYSSTQGILLHMA